MPVRGTTPDKTHMFQWRMFQIHGAPQALGTVHYLTLLFVTSFSRNYHAGRGRRYTRRWQAHIVLNQSNGGKNVMFLPLQPIY